MITLKNNNTKESETEATLFYLVGASGSGKDSILRQFRSLTHKPDSPVIIARRFITREDDSHEDSMYLSDAEFAQREHNDFFALSWQANGYRYGIGTEINEWLNSGFSVLLNGSRAYLPEAKAIYGEQLHSILVDVPEAELRARLEKRARESSEDIDQRINRHRALSKSIRCDSVLPNLHSIDLSAITLGQIIQGVIDKKQLKDPHLAKSAE